MINPKSWSMNEAKFGRPFLFHHEYEDHHADPIRESRAMNIHVSMDVPIGRPKSDIRQATGRGEDRLVRGLSGQVRIIRQRRVSTARACEARWRPATEAQDGLLGMFGCDGALEGASLGC